MKKLYRPIFKNKESGMDGGISALKAIWELFDLSTSFSQTEIRKHTGIASWLMGFSYICGLVANLGSANRNVAYIAESPVLQQIFIGKCDHAKRI